MAKQDISLGLALPASVTTAQMKAIISQFVQNDNVGFGPTQLASILAKMVDFVIANGGTLADGDYGDVTVSAGGTVITVDNLAVTLADIQNIATATFLGRTTAGTGVTEQLTVTQATAMLNVFTSTLKGLVPLSGGGTANFLRADGTWTAPAGASLTSYANGDAWITATGAGVTVSKDVVTGIWTVAVPSGVHLKSLVITFLNTDTEDAGSHIFLVFDYTGLRTYNTGYNNLAMPNIRIFPTTGTASSGSPFNVTDGGNNTNDKAYGIYATPGGGDGSDLNIKITNAPVATSNTLLIDFPNI